MSKIQLQPVSLTRMVRAVEKVRERLLRSTSALDGANVPYAVIGGNATPDVADSHRGEEFQVIELQPLVEMKLNSWRDKDRTHLRDMIDIGLIDSTWPSRFQPALSSRLQELLDDPEG